MSILVMLGEKWNPPKQPQVTFEGQTVLVTGTNSGMGLEMAKKLAALNVEKLIITTRSTSKGNVTKEKIKQWLSKTKSSQSTEIIHLTLDMGSSDGVRSFVDQLKPVTNVIHGVVLNAGINATKFEQSSECYENTIQVNTTSTIFLATLLLPMLISTAKKEKIQTHLTFVSSRAALRTEAFPTSETILTSTRPLAETSEEKNFPPGALGGQTQYSRSKLFLEYAIRHLTEIPVLRGQNGKPLVIINSVCPGAVRTDIDRNLESWFAKVASRVILNLVAMSAADGANAYLQALTQGDQSMGQLWAANQIIPEWEALKSEKGQALGNRIWEELWNMMIAWEGGVKKLLEANSTE